MKFTRQTTFKKVKRGQTFDFGQGMGCVRYKKTSSKFASPIEWSWQIMGPWKPDEVVYIE